MHSGLIFRHYVFVIFLRKLDFLVSVLLAYVRNFNFAFNHSLYYMVCIKEDIINLDNFLKHKSLVNKIYNLFINIYQFLLFFLQ